jgi:hypothetical protein
LAALNLELFTLPSNLGFLRDHPFCFSREHNTNGSLGQDVKVPDGVRWPQSTDITRTCNTEKRGLKGLDKTVFLSIVDNSVFIFCSNTTKIREILIGYTLLFAACDRFFVKI